MKKNSNHKITYEERCEMSDLKSSLMNQSERLLELAASLQGIIPKAKWSSEKWDNFVKARNVVAKLKGE